MKTVLFIAFGMVSLALIVVAIILAIRLWRKTEDEKRALSPIHLLTIFVFASVFCMFIPIYYTSYDFGDNFKIFRPLLIAFHNTIRIFILDGDFDTVVDALYGQSIYLRIPFSLHAAVLYVIAPALTFTTVLSLFKNVKNELRYKMCKNKKLYIMSELNEKSIALAKSIYEKGENAEIVFTDVFVQNEEDDYELITQAREIKAICLKRDITHLDFISKKGDVEIFLIGTDEAENVSQAVKITTELNKKNTKQNVKVFVFSIKPSAAYIIDSIEYENLIEYAGEAGYGENCFKLRRIDEQQQLMWNTIPKMNLFDIAERHDKTLSVLIVGFGNYGMEFFKMLSWYCQFEGYKLQVNIIDKKERSIDTLIDRYCPEFLKNNSDKVYPAQYDIRAFSCVDVLSSGIHDLILNDKTGRLKATNLVFVSLGDDDLNIEVSIYLRSLFDRINNVIANKKMGWNDEAVEIYSVVYDDNKSSILYSEEKQNETSQILKNHKEVPYHIHFIGDMSSQFSYDNIYNAELEKAAFNHHIGWVDIEAKIYDEWLSEGKLDKIQEHGMSPQKPPTDEWMRDERTKYEKYEYFRRSSMAKEIYQRGVKANTTLAELTACTKGGDKQTCDCENCGRRKRSEHLRWNAYTASLGFEYKKGVRADRALLHDNLCGWDDLSEKDQQKD